MSDSGEKNTRKEVVVGSDAKDEGREKVVRHQSSEEEVSFLLFVVALVKHRYTVAVSTLIIGALAVLHLLITFSPTYTSEAAFIPQSGGAQRTGELRAVAGQLGIDLSSGNEGRSPEFYRDLLESREILRPILTDTFEIRRSRTARGSLLEVLGLDSMDEPLSRERGIDWLRRTISVTIKRETGVLNLSVTTSSPDLSQSIAERLLDRVNAFNLETRQSQAAAERRFVQERLAEVAADLREAENELKRFLETNRQFQNSPELAFEYERLERQLDMRQQLFTSLTQSYEQARISEVRNTPVITILEPPEMPATRNRRGLVRRGSIGLALGMVLGIAFAFGREFFMPRLEEESEEYRKLRRVWKEAVDDLRRFIPGLEPKGRSRPL